MEKANLTPIRVALLCVTALFLCNTAIAQQTFTVSEKVNVKGTECTRTFNCYYGDNDERIMHGLCKTEGKEKASDGPNHKYTFSHSESINYAHGKKEGAYSYSLKTYSSSVDVYHDYQVNRDFKKKRSGAKIYEVIGSYKNDERDGVWKETVKETDTLAGNVTEHNKSEKNTFVFSNGKLVELTTSAGAHYKFRYAIIYGNETPLFSGKYEKYTIKDGIVISHMVRLNGDETEMDNELKQFISNKDNLFDYSDELMEKGYVITEGMVGLSIPYKPYPLCDEFDYKRCTIYKIKKEQINYASMNEVEKYLLDLSEKPIYDFDRNSSEILTSKTISVPSSDGNGRVRKYLNKSVLAETQHAITNYQKMRSDIEKGEEQITQLMDKIKKDERYKTMWNVRIKDMVDSYGITFSRIGFNYEKYTGFKFTTDTAKYQSQMRTIQKCLKMEEDFFSYIVKGDKKKNITSKVDSIKNIAGENSQIWQKYTEIYNSHNKYEFHYIRDNGDAGEWVEQYIKELNEGLIIADNCLDYARALPQLNVLKEAITASPYFSYVKTQYEASLSILGDGWNGSQNGDKVRQLIPTMEKYKNHVEALGTIDKNNEKIVMLSEKTKKIKKIYTEYYNNIQRDYNDNSIEYLNAIINNQNTLIAALEAEEPKNVDKKVKKGDAETMEDIIQIIKHQ
ncbi:MAG: hypothetical protein K6A94_07170 [Bacteroidales bacterium]|nr:hypothetical protein [Bacteroidales bacterium]